jgi:hypothetical protein
MKYVLDASVAICWVIPRPLTPKAVRLRDEYQRQSHVARTRTGDRHSSALAGDVSTDTVIFLVNAGPVIDLGVTGRPL